MMIHRLLTLSIQEFSLTPTIIFLVSTQKTEDPALSTTLTCVSISDARSITLSVLLRSFCTLTALLDCLKYLLLFLFASGLRRPSRHKCRDLHPLHRLIYHMWMKMAVLTSSLWMDFLRIMECHRPKYLLRLFMDFCWLSPLPCTKY